MLVESIAYIIYCMVHWNYFYDGIKNHVDRLVFFGFLFFVTVIFTMCSYPDDKDKEEPKQYTSEDILDEIEMYKDGELEYTEYTFKDGSSVKLYSKETNQ